MSKSDYEALAGLIRRQADRFRSDIDQAGFVEAAADWLADDNPRFDRVRFLRACGVEVR